jgi:hypothetical protein
VVRGTTPLLSENLGSGQNAYFLTYMNPLTQYGPFQNISGRTGVPVAIVPACKFQDPEFHSGKNLLSIVEVARRTGLM